MVRTTVMLWVLWISITFTTSSWQNASHSSCLNTREHIDVSVSFSPAAQWLSQTLANCNIPFKIYNLGAGVTRFTTNTITCPCFKKPI